MSKKEKAVENYDNVPRHLKTKANKFERVKANNNVQTLNYYGVIDLFQFYKDGALSKYSDVQIRHEEDWSGISLGWGFQILGEDEAPYTVGKGIFATVKNEDVFISYSGLDSQQYLVSQSNIGDLIHDGIEKAQLPESL
jgi:hypothetical protein